ncbi:hypothetical protein JHK82_048428 [Glycine max]|nr:hypothetical protein JHK82_048428 [Glycine max]
MSQKGSQVSAPTHADVNVLGARVSTKESIAEIGVNPSGEEQIRKLDDSEFRNAFSRAFIWVILEVLVVIQGGAILEASAAVHISHRSHSYSDSSRRFTLVALLSFDMGDLNAADLLTQETTTGHEMKEQELNGSEEKSSNSGEDLATMFSGKNGEQKLKDIFEFTTAWSVVHFASKLQLLSNKYGIWPLNQVSILRNLSDEHSEDTLK